MFFSNWWPYMPIPFPIIFVGLCLIIFLFVMVPMMRGHRSWGGAHDRAEFPQRTALDILNERFASGEIGRAEYEEKRRLILS